MTTTTMTMEMLPQIRQTLSEIDDRVPDALRVGLGFGNRVSPAPPPGENDDVADFADSLLQPLTRTEDNDSNDGGGGGSEKRPKSDCVDDRVSPPPPPGEDDGVADVAASLLQPLAATTDDDGGGPEKQPKAAAPALALRIDWGSCYLPRYDHDAHFGNADVGVVAVADGVGSYMKDGVDAAAFSRGLMRNAAADIAAGVAEELLLEGYVCPRALLKQAYKKTAASRAQGASTAVIVSLAGDALRWVCIGDSSFAVVRDGRVVFLSEPQQELSRKSKQDLLHFRHDKKRRGCPAARYKLVFSFDDPPFQLSAKGGNRVEEAKTSYRDASNSHEAAVPVRAGDVVVLGTDGLFQNVLLGQLEGAVRVGSRLGFSPKNMADIIAAVAYERSKEELDRKECKGKPDDITVVVAFVVQSAPSPVIGVNSSVPVCG
ncbi:unnamed protein product [Urochloa humidicola]